MEIVDLNPIIIPNKCGLRRDMPRPIELRDDSYVQKFDSNTLFYDVFQVGNRIFLIGPPLFNLKSVLQNSTIYIDNVKVKGSDVNWGEQHRSSITTIKLNDTSRHYKIRIVNKYFSSETYISRNRIANQLDKNVLVTINKNNKIDWICDWAKYYSISEQIDTIIIYDNDSTDYTIEELASMLSVVKKIKFYIVKTPFPFGPQGGPTDLNGKLTHLPWDSFYLHGSILSHSRFYFCNRANFYLNVDIDELVIVKTGGTIKELMQNKNLNYICFSQAYVYSKKIDETLQISDVYFKEEKSSFGCQKWACLPSKIDEKFQFDCHLIHGLKSNAVSNIIKYHLYPISSSWNTSRDDKIMTKGEVSRELAIKFNQIFNTNIDIDSTESFVKNIIKKYGEGKVELLEKDSVKLSLSNEYTYVINIPQNCSVIMVYIISVKHEKLMEIYSKLQNHMLVSPPDFYAGDTLKRNRLEIVNIPFDYILEAEKNTFNVIANLEKIIQESP